MLDLDFGTYPFVTSSNPSIGGIVTGLGLAPNKFEAIIGVVRALAFGRRLLCFSCAHPPASDGSSSLCGALYSSSPVQAHSVHPQDALHFSNTNAGQGLHDARRHGPLP